LQKRKRPKKYAHCSKTRSRGAGEGQKGGEGREAGGVSGLVLNSVLREMSGMQDPSIWKDVNNNKKGDEKERDGRRKTYGDISDRTDDVAPEK